MTFSSCLVVPFVQRRGTARWPSMITGKLRCHWQGTKRSFTTHWIIPPHLPDRPLHIALKNRWALIEMIEGAASFSHGSTRLRLDSGFAAGISVAEFNVDLETHLTGQWQMRLHLFDRFPFPGLFARDGDPAHWLSSNRNAPPGIYELGPRHWPPPPNGPDAAANPAGMFNSYLASRSPGFFAWLASGPCRHLINPRIPSGFCVPAVLRLPAAQQASGPPESSFAQAFMPDPGKKGRKRRKTQGGRLPSGNGKALG